MNRGVIFYAVLGVLIFSLPAFGFGAFERRTIAELELMDDVDLAEAALYPCIELTSNNALKGKIADLPSHSLVSEYKKERLRQEIDTLEYFDAIALVARKKNGGEEPPWIMEMWKVGRGTDGKACGEISRKVRNQYFEEQMRQAVERDKKREAEKSQKQKVK